MACSQLPTITLSTPDTSIEPSTFFSKNLPYPTTDSVLQRLSELPLPPATWIQWINAMSHNARMNGADSKLQHPQQTARKYSSDTDSIRAWNLEQKLPGIRKATNKFLP